MRPMSTFVQFVVYLTNIKKIYGLRNNRKKSIVLTISINETSLGSCDY